MLNEKNVCPEKGRFVWRVCPEGLSGGFVRRFVRRFSPEGLSGGLSSSAGKKSSSVVEKLSSAVKKLNSVVKMQISRILLKLEVCPEVCPDDV